MAVSALLVACAVLLASAAGQAVVQNGSQWIANPYPKIPAACCRQPLVEVCGGASARLGWPFDPGCALRCSALRGGGPPGYFQCRGSDCLCYS